MSAHLSVAAQLVARALATLPPSGIAPTGSRQFRQAIHARLPLGLTISRAELRQAVHELTRADRMPTLDGGAR